MAGRLLEMEKRNALDHGISSYSDDPFDYIEDNVRGSIRIHEWSVM
jgi:hypothetical protein